MATIKIIGASHPGRFAKELGEDNIVVSESVERYSAEILLVQKYRCRILHDYLTGNVVLWFDNRALTVVLKKILSLTKYLGRALIIGVIAKQKFNIEGEAFIKIPGGTMNISQMGEGLWIGWDGTNYIFSATIQGVAELIELLEERP